jgi:hypothetical protein
VAYVAPIQVQSKQGIDSNSTPHVTNVTIPLARLQWAMEAAPIKPAMKK